MSCSPNELKEYFFGELPETEQRAVRAHIEECPGCREELDRLRLTEASLLAVREEEMPRRIGFVSDKVFEPRWWQRAWRSGPGLGFAAALMLAAAIVGHGVLARAPAAVDQAAIEARVTEEVARRLEPAIAAAVAESEKRQASKAEQLVAEARKEFDFERQADRIAFADNVRFLEKKYMQWVKASYGGEQ
jgi:anti-sigma factor RsiW